MTKSLLALLLLLVSGFSFANSENSNQNHKTLKSLSNNEINNYLTGKGMGFAKPAELNNYPGPRHVLDISDELSLSKNQIDKTKFLFNQMQSTAKKLGAILIDKEMDIENLFSSSKATSENLSHLLIESANIKAKIRLAHLTAHIQQKDILNKHQIIKYNEIRGYSGDIKSAHKHHH